MKRLEMCRSQGFTRNLGAEKIDRCHGEESVESTGLDTQIVIYCEAAQPSMWGPFHRQLSNLWIYVNS